MDKAIEVILSKRTPEDEWKLSSHHPGKAHFVIKQAGKPGSWNILRVLKFTGISENHQAGN